MSTFNIKLLRRRKSIVVDRIFTRRPKFIVICDQNKIQHELSEIDFPSYEWESIGVGSKIELTIAESIVGMKAIHTRFQEKVKRFLDNPQKKFKGLFFTWICYNCQTMDCVEFEDGDDPQVIIEHICESHKNKNGAKPDCNRSRIRLFDRNGNERKDLAQALFLVEIK